MEYCTITITLQIPEWFIALSTAVAVVFPVLLIMYATIERTPSQVRQTEHDSGIDLSLWEEHILLSHAPTMSMQPPPTPGALVAAITPLDGCNRG